MMYFLPDNIKTEALLKSGQQLIKDPSKWCKGAMQKGDSFCINGALFAVGTPNPRMPDEFVSEDVLYFQGRSTKRVYTRAFLVSQEGTQS